MISRRGLVLGGATLAAGTAVARGIWLWRARSFDFRPLDTPKGFREIPRQSVTTGAMAFVGLDAGEATPARLAADPCAALFPRRIAGAVPVAAFTDVHCPFCKVLTPILADLSLEGRIALNWQELPELGPSSVAAARAALAADMQGKGTAFRLRLMRTSFLPTPDYLRALAPSLGLDAARLLRDAQSSTVTRELALSRALARAFAVPGTPALVVGRTLVVGAIPRTRLEALVALEAAQPGAPCA